MSTPFLTPASRGCFSELGCQDSGGGWNAVLCAVHLRAGRG
ncbi:predicted protein [Plenodomus lingam JN3]|uniref:Predicted protein n=1 Tax=Leptosphaeria maculans (strain JN3 / isolate v23.1.3 / race Av1-4-5-6-7-8) TaxID=985895 RepID=E4ZK18_LEPMJ|nr:predicted protein [Plenodomus lingam JN3]CBX91613.1 predicted protein [Plenodomus lingam JN3]